MMKSRFGVTVFVLLAFDWLSHSQAERWLQDVCEFTSPRNEVDFENGIPDDNEQISIPAGTSKSFSSKRHVICSAI
jgi:hypothetical protein